MTYQKINVLTELRKLAKGKPTKTPAWLIAELSIPRVQAGMRNLEIEKLERLFDLPDTRD